MSYIPSYLKNYKRLRRVKCLHPHTITYPNGKTEQVTRDKLLKTRDKMNERARANTLATASTDHIITVDSMGNQHTKASKDITLLGYECVWDYGRMADGKEWLYCDAFIRPDRYEQAREMPFTSVEYHPTENVISNLAFTKLRPVLDVDTITPYHWERGEVNAAGMPVPLVAYSVESRQGPVVVYSTEQHAMSANPLKAFAESQVANAQSSLAAAQALLAASDDEAIVPAVKPAPVVSLSTEKPHPDTIKLRAIERRRSLEALKSAGRNVDVDKEMEAWADAPDNLFNIHLSFAAQCYSTQASGGARVDPLDGSGSGNNDALLASRAELAMKNIVKRQAQFMNFHQCLERCKADPGFDGTRD